MVPSLPTIYPDCVGLVYWLMLWHVCFCFIGIIGLVLLQTSLAEPYMADTYCGGCWAHWEVWWADVAV